LPETVIAKGIIAFGNEKLSVNGIKGDFLYRKSLLTD